MISNTMSGVQYSYNFCVGRSKRSIVYTYPTYCFQARSMYELEHRSPCIPITAIVNRSMITPNCDTYRNREMGCCRIFLEISSSPIPTRFSNFFALFTLRILINLNTRHLFVTFKSLVLSCSKLSSHQTFQSFRTQNN
jgi:hypothetical protein